jgi:hypothetical protein
MNRTWTIGIAVFAAVMAAAPAPAQERLGRMYFTPAQRASLDIARSQRARTALATEKIEQDATPVPQTITYSGVVRRSDGRTTVWINNQPVHDRESAGAAAIVGRVRPDGSVTLQVPQSGRSVSLKPGQSVELLSGAVEEGYSRRVDAPAPKPESKPAAKPAAAAGKGKPAAPDNAAQREREERETQRLEDAISRALVETASARPLATPAPAPPANP